MASPFRSSPLDYWNQGVQNVPYMTGAASLMDGADIREHAEKLGFELPFENLLDVGCGTGRLSAFASIYYAGVDISADAIAYCHNRGIGHSPSHHVARRIDGPEDIRVPETAIGFPFDWITCLSVFTHIGRPERQAYLSAFSTTRAYNLLVDIIPGDGTGDVALWTADWEEFQQDVRDAGWSIKAWYDRVGPSGPTHRYSWAVRA